MKLKDYTLRIMGSQVPGGFGDPRTLLYPREVQLILRVRRSPAVQIPRMLVHVFFFFRMVLP